MQQEANKSNHKMKAKGGQLTMGVVEVLNEPGTDDTSESVASTD